MFKTLLKYASLLLATFLGRTYERQKIKREIEQDRNARQLKIVQRLIKIGDALEKDRAARANETMEEKAARLRNTMRNRGKF